MAESAAAEEDLDVDELTAFLDSEGRERVDVSESAQDSSEAQSMNVDGLGPTKAAGAVDIAEERYLASGTQAAAGRPKAAARRFVIKDDGALIKK